MATIACVEPMPNTATRAERYAAGKALRAKAPRTSHGECRRAGFVEPENLYMRQFSGSHSSM
jgi:hypothetical protein